MVLSIFAHLKQLQELLYSRLHIKFARTDIFLQVTLPNRKKPTGFEPIWFSFCDLKCNPVRYKLVSQIFYQSIMPPAFVPLPPIKLDCVATEMALTKYAAPDSAEQDVCAIRLTQEGFPFMTLSVFIEGRQASPWSFWVKTWSENFPYIDPVLEQCPWFVPVESLPPNHFGVQAERWEINPDELDPKTVEAICHLMEWEIPADRHIAMQSTQQHNSTHAP